MYVKLLTAVASQRTSEYHLEHQVCRRQTVVIFTHVSSLYQDKVNDTEIAVIENQISL